MNQHAQRIAILGLGLGLVACAPSGRQQVVARGYASHVPGSYATVEHRLTVGNTEEPLKGAEVSQTFFEAAAPIVGRFFTAADYQPNAAPVIVIHHELWQARFGGSVAVIGRQVQLDGQSFTVVGVVPLGFNSPEQASFWLPRRPS